MHQRQAMLDGHFADLEDSIAPESQRIVHHEDTFRAYRDCLFEGEVQIGG